MKIHRDIFELCDKIRNLDPYKIESSMEIVKILVDFESDIRSGKLDKKREMNENPQHFYLPQSENVNAL